MNLFTVRGLESGLLKREKSEKVGGQTKRRMCGWESDYSLKALAVLDAIHLAQGYQD